MNKILLAGALSLALSFQAFAGAIFITGHDSDEHTNVDYMSAGLDYLAFGSAAALQTDRNSFSVALLNDGSYDRSTELDADGWDSTYFDVTNVGWDSSVFASTNGVNDFNMIMVGSGSAQNFLNELLSNTANFATFFNNGGGIFVNTDEGYGQGWYNFIPSFGATQNNNISTSGAFTATAAGNAIGLTEAIVDADITHSYYTGVDTNLFTVFETYNGTGDPVAIGLREASIIDGGFSTSVPEPASLVLLALSLMGLRISSTKKRK